MVDESYKRIYVQKSALKLLHNLIYASVHTTFMSLQFSMRLVMIVSISAKGVYMFCQT